MPSHRLLYLPRGQSRNLWRDSREAQEIPLPLGAPKLMLSTSQMLCKVHRQAGTNPKLLMQSASLSYFELVSDRSLDMVFPIVDYKIQGSFESRVLLLGSKSS